MTSVFVINTSGEEFVDSFNGTKYCFPPREEVEIPEEAAIHIFGYGAKDKTPWVIRLGWTVTRNDIEKAFARLDKFKISGETRRSLSPAVEQVPPVPARRMGGKPAMLDA